jgi:hypothetical protein
MDPTDYGLAPGERLNDAITRSWNRLRTVWETFRKAEAELPATDQTATSLTRERWLRPLLDELGFAGLPIARTIAIDGKDYAVSHQWGTTVPIHLPGARVTIDRPTRGIPGAAQTSPYGLVQELLNRSEIHRWGIVCNGRLLRILRDNASLTRRAYLEFDLEAIFASEAFSDFVVLWLCGHRTRFEGEPAEKCLLEQWTTEAVTAGTRALDKLRTGVEDAIQQLGEGFVVHPGNAPLRQALRSREVTNDELKNQLLRLVYRLLFLLVAESRDLLLDDKASENERQRYRSFYSIDRIRALAARRRGTTHDDLWASLRVTMTALGSTGAPELGLAPLGSFLWSPTAIAALARSSIDNRHLLEAIRDLCFTPDADARALRPVDYRNLGAEELGSIYESLLELHADVDADARTFSLATAAGNDRKTTGSYYTPSSLIRVLLDSALDPVLAEAEAAPDPEAAILGLKVLDPAAGSGHFLIAAAHRIAGRLAFVRSGGVEPSPADLRHALREVISRCLYAIDVNPMALELCKVSLWMEGTEPGRPLSFLDHHIVCGNSLLGSTPALLAEGVPDDAFKVLEGDDKTTVGLMKKANKSERIQARSGQGALALGPSLADLQRPLAAGLAGIEALGADTPAQVAEQERRFAELFTAAGAERARLAADAWCAAFVAPKRPGEPVITDATVRAIERGDPVEADVLQTVGRVRDQYGLLHLHHVFPHVLRVPEPLDPEGAGPGWDGGFDVVLGNPPWERVKLQEREFFAQRAPDIAAASNAATRKRLIAELVDTDPGMHQAFREALRQADGESHLLRSSGRYPLCGRGDVNTYTVFAENMRALLAPTGRAGVVVPIGIATDDTTKHFFADIVERRSLVSLFGFENEEFVFPGIDHRVTFCLLTLAGGPRPEAEMTFVFAARQVAALADPERRFSLTAEDLCLLSPNTRTCPVFRRRRDAELARAVHRRFPVLVQEGSPDLNPWALRFNRMIDMATDSGLFRNRDSFEPAHWRALGNVFEQDGERFLPLYEAKMLHFFDHRYGTYQGQTQAQANMGTLPRLTLEQRNDPAFLPLPRYWVAEAECGEAVKQPYFLAFRDVARNTDQRSCVATILPPVAVGHKAPLVSAETPYLLGAIMQSFVFDYFCRTKLSGTSLSFFVLKQLPVPLPETLQRAAPWDKTMSIADWVRMRVLELTYTAWDLEPFAHDLGWSGPPFRWIDDRRSVLRAELDACWFHVYGTAREDTDYILSTFPVVNRIDRERNGEERTRRLVLERYDAIAEAEAAGSRYTTVLDPPPSHPSLAHTESTRPGWARSAAGA